MKLHLTMALIAVLSASCSKDEKKSQAPSNTSTLLVEEREREKAKTELASAENRSESMEQLMNNREGVGSKVVTARDYFLSQDFQRIKAANKESLEIMYVNAVNEFINYISDVHAKIRPNWMSPLRKRTRNSERTFYAFASAMDVTSQLTNISFYDLIRTAMINEINGDELAPHERILVAGPNREIMIDLIKARVDIMAAQGLRYLTTDKNLSLLQKGNKVLFDLSFGLLGSIDLPETFADSNEETKNMASHYMNEALKAKNFLREFGITKELEKKVRSAYMKIELSMPKQSNPEMDEESLTPKQLQVLEERRIEFRNLINNLLQ